jgi:hypothetical protein
MLHPEIPSIFPMNSGDRLHDDLLVPNDLVDEDAGLPSVVLHDDNDAVLGGGDRPVDAE